MSSERETRSTACKCIVSEANALWETEGRKEGREPGCGGGDGSGDQIALFPFLG